MEKGRGRSKASKAPTSITHMERRSLGWEHVLSTRADNVLSLNKLQK